MLKGGYIYFLTNKYNKVLYTGVTNDLRRRVAKINKGFTYRYNCDKLVYFEVYDSIVDAIRREKQLKNWKRAWKDDLINSTNPLWKEMSMEIGVDDAFIQEVKKHYCGSSPQ